MQRRRTQRPAPALAQGRRSHDALTSSGDIGAAAAGDDRRGADACGSDRLDYKGETPPSAGLPVLGRRSNDPDTKDGTGTGEGGGGSKGGGGGPADVPAAMKPQVFVVDDRGSTSTACVSQLGRVYLYLGRPSVIAWQPSVIPGNFTKDSLISFSLQPAKDTTKLTITDLDSLSQKPGPVLLVPTPNSLTFTLPATAPPGSTLSDSTNLSSGPEYVINASYNNGDNTTSTTLNPIRRVYLIDGDPETVSCVRDDAPVPYQVPVQYILPPIAGIILIIAVFLTVLYLRRKRQIKREEKGKMWDHGDGRVPIVRADGRVRHREWIGDRWMRQIMPGPLDVDESGMVRRPLGEGAIRAEEAKYSERVLSSVVRHMRRHAKAPQQADLEPGAIPMTELAAAPSVVASAGREEMGDVKGSTDGVDEHRRSYGSGDDLIDPSRVSTATTVLQIPPVLPATPTTASSNTVRSSSSLRSTATIPSVFFINVLGQGRTKTSSSTSSTPPPQPPPPVTAIPPTPPANSSASSSSSDALHAARPRPSGPPQRDTGGPSSWHPPKLAKQNAFIVQNPHRRENPDELDISRFESVRVVRVLEDGWCEVTRPNRLLYAITRLRPGAKKPTPDIDDASGDRGLVPFDCLVAILDDQVLVRREPTVSVVKSGDGKEIVGAEAPKMKSLMMGS